MKILFLDSPSYGKEDICEAYTLLGYEVVFSIILSCMNIIIMNLISISMN